MSTTPGERPAFAFHADQDRRALEEFLNDDQAEPIDLAWLLAGSTLPAIGYEDPPYVRILRAIPAEPQLRRPVELKLARRAAELLWSRGCDEFDDAGRRVEILDNLYNLCVGIAAPRELAEPLWTEYLRFRDDPGMFRPQFLLAALRDALVENQIDSRLWNVWRAMLAGDPLVPLVGGQDVGFRGLRLMPPSPDRLGHPAIDEIGAGLGIIAEKLTDIPGRRVEFRKRIASLERTYPGHLSWSRDLILAADRNGWPAWAVTCISSLFEPAEVGTSNQETWFVWRIICLVLPMITANCTGELCKGEVLQVCMSPDLIKDVDEIVRNIEDLRLKNPFDSNKSLINAVLTGILVSPAESKAVDNNLDSRTSVPEDSGQCKSRHVVDGKAAERVLRQEVGIAYV